MRTGLTAVLVSLVVMALVGTGPASAARVPTAPAAPVITITDLDTLGGDDSRAEGINNQGQIVGMSTTTTDGQRRAFLWEDGLMTNLGSLGGNHGNPDEINSYAYDINNQGQIVGFCRNEGSSSLWSPYWRSFLWEDGEMTDLRHEGRFDAASGINDQGQIVGMFYYYGWFRPFLWQDGAFTLLGTVDREGSAYGINDLGQIVGESGGRAFLWEDGVMTDLGTLGGDSSSARSINNQGQIVGYTTAGVHVRAFLWEDGVTIDLGVSFARAINNRGQIVGSSGGRAFLWEDGVITDLGTLGGDSSAAYGINDHGQIVGESTTADSQTRATLWTVPAPALTLVADEATLSGEPGERVSYSLTLTNTGNISDTFELALSANSWPAQLSDASVTLAWGASTEITVTVDIPTSALAGDEDGVTVTATSETDAGVSASVTVTTRTDPVHGLTLVADEAARSGEPGETVSYSLTLTNTGNATDTFELALSANSWPAQFSETSVTLAWGASTEITVTVDVPTSALAGDEDAVTVSATSEADASVSDSVTLTTRADPVYGLTLVADEAARSAEPGETVSYNLTLTHTGNVVDTFGLALSGNRWPAQLSEASVTLVPGASAAITVTVDIPAGTVDGDEDAVTVTATSTGDPTVTAGEELVTLVRAQQFRIYLPLVSKN